MGISNVFKLSITAILCHICPYLPLYMMAMNYFLCHKFIILFIGLNDLLELFNYFECVDFESEIRLLVSLRAEVFNLFWLRISPPPYSKFLYSVSPLLLTIIQNSPLWTTKGPWNPSWEPLRRNQNGTS